MKRYRNNATKILIGLLIAAILGSAANAATEGDLAPQWSLHSVADQLVTFPQAADGKPSVILFWATWCPYCKALMPYLSDIRDQYSSQGVTVFAINIKENGDPLAFANAHSYDFVYLLDGDAIAERYSVRFTPGLFVVDADGQIVFRRKSTDLPAGRKVAEYWAERVTTALDGILDDSK